MQCSIVVTNDNGGTIGDSSDLSSYTSNNNNNNYTSGQSTNDRVLAIFKPAFTGSTKLHRYVQGKSHARQGLGLASGQGKLALVSVQRETPVVALEPLSSTQEDSPQHPHHRTTLLADIASAGNYHTPKQHTLSTHHNIPYRHTLSTHHNTPYQSTLSIHSLIPPSQSILSSHPHIPPSQPTHSTHPHIPPSQPTLRR